MDLKRYIREIPDFPKPGVVFYDITPLLHAPEAFRWSIDTLAATFADARIDAIVAAEARGFLLASALAYKLGCALVPMRKPGKLPWKTRSARYLLEYGSAELHMHEDAVAQGDRVLIVDDLLATGGTARAMIELVEKNGGEVVGVACLMELAFLKPRASLEGYHVESLMRVE